jgi:cytochrome P450
MWRPVRWWSGVLGRHAIARIAGRPGLPPGSLGPRAVARFGNDQFYLNRFRKYGPIVKLLWSRKLTVCISGFERGRRLLAVHTAALQPRAIEIESFVPNGFLRRMRGDVHRRYRAEFLEAFRLELPETELRSLIRSELAALATLHAAGPATPQHLATALDRIALRSLLVICFGLSSESDEFRMLESQFGGLKSWVYPRTADQYQAFHALQGTVVSVARSGIRLHNDGPDSVMRRLPQAGLSLTDDETVLGNLIYMVDTGRYDIRGLFRWVLKYLSDHPHVIDDLRERRTKVEAVSSFAEACVLETLRLDQAEALGRDVTNDFVFEGFLIPKGSALRVALRESHRDAQTFPAPDEYRPCRFATRKYGPDAYAPFGIGEHRCIAGNHVVRLATWLVEELVDGFDWTVAADGPRHRGLYHWEPSPLFSLRLRARSA